MKLNEFSPSGDRNIEVYLTASEMEFGCIKRVQLSDARNVSVRFPAGVRSGVIFRIRGNNPDRSGDALIHVRMASRT